eukprot:6194158-Pleurochrysis_carterae.AAC.1
MGKLVKPARFVAQRRSLQAPWQGCCLRPGHVKRLDLRTDLGFVCTHTQMSSVRQKAGSFRHEWPQSICSYDLNVALGNQAHFQQHCKIASTSSTQEEGQLGKREKREWRRRHGVATKERKLGERRSRANTGVCAWLPGPIDGREDALVIIVIYEKRAARGAASAAQHAAFGHAQRDVAERLAVRGAALVVVVVVVVVPLRRARLMTKRSAETSANGTWLRRRKCDGGKLQAN